LLAVLAPLAALLLLPVKIAVNANFWDALMDAAHVPIFAFATWLCFHTNPLGLVRRRDALAGAALLAGVGAGAIELLQTCTGRSGNLPDLAYGTLGIAAATAALTRRPGATTALTLLAAAIVLPPPLAEARGLAWRAQHFPLLGDFESDAELRLWLAEDRDTLVSGAPRARVPQHATRGTHSLRVPIRPGNWPGVRLLCGDRDWSAHRTFAFDLYNDGPPFTLAFRIDDARSSTHADRYNAALPIAPGANALRLPLAAIARAIDVRRVRRVVFFELEPKTEHTFYLDHVRLE
jgi:hypothetical protein